MEEKKRDSEIRDVQGVSQVDLRDFGSLVVKQGAEESLTIQADADLLPKIRSEVRKNTLVLGIGRDWMERAFSGYDFIKQRRVNYELVVKHLDSVSISGKYDVSVKDVDSQILKIHSSGASKIELDDLTTDQLQVDISGRCQITGSGKVIEQSIKCSGSSEYQASDLESQKSKITISGRSRVEVWAEQSLSVAISGMGTVIYRGQPSISQKISGMGEVKQAEKGAVDQ